MKNIIPVLWFEKDGEKAAEFYTSVFPKSKLKGATYGPDGKVITMDFEIGGVDLGILNGGANFEKNPSISFTVYLESKEEIDAVWKALSNEGKVLMPLKSYEFSEYYGWVQDAYSVSWQLTYGKNMDSMVVPSLLFTKDHYGQAEEAIGRYTSIFEGSRIHDLYHYGEDQLTNHKEALMYGAFQLGDQKFIAMDSGLDHEYTFNEGISLMVLCDSQEEIDQLWDTLSAVPHAEQCGWLKDQFGVSWQIVPRVLNEYLRDEDKDRANRVMDLVLKMKKLEIGPLKAAYTGEE
ncbi:VOC family protein [Caldalkalibacillus mannanilyticus]|uniref:VOC family protein n=1 Tax=Caldalkalibacillus mannanilyticus TaxID=1418 RepID=UPI000468FDFC|nr:VOC family protein [Caldalkalibacillus mannanilyticus]